MQDIASALAYLHARGTLHGDLTGNNCLLDASPEDPRGFVAKVSAGPAVYHRCQTSGWHTCSLPPSARPPLAAPSREHAWGAGRRGRGVARQSLAVCLLTSHWSPVIGGYNFLWLVRGLSSCGASLTRLAHPTRACCTHHGSRQGVCPRSCTPPLSSTHTRGRHLPFFLSFVLSCCRHMPAELLEGGF